MSCRRAPISIASSSGRSGAFEVLLDGEDHQGGWEGEGGETGDSDLFIGDRGGEGEWAEEGEVEARPVEALEPDAAPRAVLREAHREAEKAVVDRGVGAAGEYGREQA